MAAIKMITPPMQAKFVNLDEFASFDGISTGKFTVTFFADAKHTALFTDAVQEAGGGVGNNPITIIADDAQYDAGMVRFKGSSKFPIKVIGKNKESLPNSVVEGATVRAAVTFADYSAGPNRGVTVYLNSIQVLEEGGSNIDFGDLPDGYEPGADLDDPLPF
jgi:hypothetical protein